MLGPLRRDVGVYRPDPDGVPVPPSWTAPPTSGGELCLGLDEAGRGSLVGPLVVGGFAARPDVLASLPGLGVRDSKLLSPVRREEAYERLASVGERYALALSPAVVDRAVRRGQLNELEARAFAELVRQVRPARAFVDACDPVAPRFGERVALLAGRCSEVHAQHRADRELAIVAAASIVAKVTRDRHLERLRRRLGEELGSGYPSDGRTRAFVRASLESGATPRWVRASWRTTETLKAELSTRTLESFDR